MGCSYTVSDSLSLSLSARDDEGNHELSYTKKGIIASVDFVLL